MNDTHIYLPSKAGPTKTRSVGHTSGDARRNIHRKWIISRLSMGSSMVMVWWPYHHFPKRSKKDQQKPIFQCHFRWVEVNTSRNHTRNGDSESCYHRRLGATLQARLESFTCAGRSVGEPLSAIAAVETLGRGVGYWWWREVDRFHTKGGLYRNVSKNRGGPPKWMVKIMENLKTLLKWMIWGVKTFSFVQHPYRNVYV